MQKIHKALKYLVNSLILVIVVPVFASAQVNPNADVEAKVRMSFVDMPDMITIAQCESGFRQFAPNGSPLHGGSSKRYIGIFQIDEQIHAAKATSMAYDINTVDGNIAYARYMFFASGSNPWKGCLGGSPAAPAPVPAIQPAPAPAPAALTPTASINPTPITGALTANLNSGMTNSQVVILQQILNKSGYVIAASGPGSPGNETSYFGSLTREAVRKFQCAKGIACDGSESSTGFGRVGPMTRAALNQSAGQ